MQRRHMWSYRNHMATHCDFGVNEGKPLARSARMGRARRTEVLSSKHRLDVLDLHRNAVENSRALGVDGIGRSVVGSGSTVLSDVAVFVDSTSSGLNMGLLL